MTALSAEDVAEINESLDRAFEVGSHIDDEPFDEYGPEDVDGYTGPPLTYAGLMEEVEANRKAFSSPEGSTSRVWVVDGRNVAVRVRNGCLEVEDGVAPYRRTRTLTRGEAGSQVVRVLVTGAGMVTTEAMTWCHLQGVPLVVARTGQEPTMMGAPVLFDHAGLRRAQALTSADEDLALGILRWLLDRRLSDQARTAGELLGRPDQADAVHLLRRQLIAASSTNEAMVVEARAAERYWSCWDGTPIRFVPADRARVPEHWLTFRGRRSPLLAGKATNRHAADPLNAALNYGYKLAEIESVVALLAVGLDPAMGWGHANRLGRPAAALDLMEAGRGVVEELVWRLASERTFHKADFREDHTGQVWLRPPFSHHLTGQLMSALAYRLGPLAEELAQHVASAVEPSSAFTVPTPLTNGKRQVARRRQRGRHPLPVTKWPSREGLLHLWTCPECGAEVANPRHVLCTACQEKQGHTARARQTRGRAIAARKRALKDRVDAFGADIDPAIYRERIWPRLAAVKLSEIVEATGYSKGYASYIRAGKFTPHVSTWPALAELAGIEVAGGGAGPERAVVVP